MVFKSVLAGRHRIIPEKNAPGLGLRHKMKVFIALACVFTAGRLVKQGNRDLCAEGGEQSVMSMSPVL